MKQLLTLTAFIIILSLSMPLAAQMGRGTASPEIHPDKSITFRYSAPNASSVSMSAEFLSTSVPLTKGENGVWSVTVDPVEPDIYPYSFVVDGVQVSDPNNPHLFPNERFKRSIVDIPGDQPLIHSMQDVPHGKVSYEYYRSGTLDMTRQLLVYTPPGYDKDESREYPVLYLIHGMTDTEETWFKVGKTNLILDNLIAMDEAVPMIIVMPYANVQQALREQNRQAPAAAPGTDLFTTELLEDIIPYIESNFRVKSDSDSRAIAGFSLGGRQTLTAGLGNPDVFTWVCAFAPAIFAQQMEANFQNVYAPSHDLISKLNLLYVSCGKDDSLYQGSVDLLKALDARYIPYKSLLNSGGHTWMNCRIYLTEIAKLLFQ